MSLPQENRIKKKKDFEAVFKNSKSFRSNLFVLKIAHNNLEVNRFGFVVSTKVSKKAIIRNKIKRRLAETVKLEMSRIKKGTDLVFVALPGICNKDYSEVKGEVDSALAKTRVTIQE